MTELLLYIVLGLQAVGLVLIVVLWRRQSSSAGAALQNQERLETLLREEMASNSREAGDDAGAAADKLAEYLAVVQRENLAFREHLNERLATSFIGFAEGLAGQVESSGAEHKDELTQIRSALIAAFGELEAAMATQLKQAAARQDERLERFEQRLIAMGERSAEQIHSMDDAIMEHLEMLQNGGAEHAANGETPR